MKMKTTILLLLVLGAAGCASLAPFGRADSDENGRISREEAAGSEELLAVFSSADTNQDGALSSAEFDEAQELIRRWKHAHGESDGAGSGGGGDGHSGHQH